MIYKDFKDRQDKIVSDFNTFKKKCTEESNVLNNEYLEEIELCMLDVEDFLSDKRVEEFIHWDPRLIFYKYDLTGKDVQKFRDLNAKLEEYIGKEAYYFKLDINGKNYREIPGHLQDYNPLTFRYFFDKLTREFINKPDRHNDGEWHS